MLYAERGNRVKQISEQDIPKYVEQGYTITDGQGTVIKETVPTDLPSLKLAYDKHIKEIESLNKAIALRDEEIAKLQKQILDMASSQVQSVETPKKSSKKSVKAETEEVKTEEE